MRPLWSSCCCHRSLKHLLLRIVRSYSAVALMVMKEVTAVFTTGSGAGETKAFGKDLIPFPKEQKPRDTGHSGRDHASVPPHVPSATRPAPDV